MNGCWISSFCFCLCSPSVYSSHGCQNNPKMLVVSSGHSIQNQAKWISGSLTLSSPFSPISSLNLSPVNPSPWSLHYSHSGLVAISGILWAHFYLRAFAFATPHPLNVISLGVYKALSQFFRVIAEMSPPQ